MSDVFWYHDARQLDDSDERCTVTQNENEGLCRLQLRYMRSRDAGTYLAVAVNDDATCRHVFYVTVNSMLLIAHLPSRRTPPPNPPTGGRGSRGWKGNIMG